LVTLTVGLRHADLQGDGIISSEDARRYRFVEVRQRYHQARFRRDVLQAYRHRCAVCALKQPELVEASHIVRDVDPAGIAAVVNGIALCAIHHLAFDRNLMGIDPGGVVHIGRRLLDEQDGPMLKNGLQGFHGSPIVMPRVREHRPDPDRLAIRFAEFEAAACSKAPQARRGEHVVANRPTRGRGALGRVRQPGPTPPLLPPPPLVPPPVLPPLVPPEVPPPVGAGAGAGAGAGVTGVAGAVGVVVAGVTGAAGVVVAGVVPAWGATAAWPHSSNPKEAAACWKDSSAEAALDSALVRPASSPRSAAS
jgi:hypothetical protein